MPTTDQALPILDYESLENIVEEPEITTGQHTEQVAIEISEDLAEVECGRMSGLRREHVPQDLPQRSGPISQHGDRRVVDFCCGCKVRSSKFVRGGKRAANVAMS
jgi:hypothetical protein